MKTANVEANVGNATIGASVTGGLLATINEYAVVLSLGLTLVGLLVGVFFHILAVKDRRKQMEQERKDKLDMAQMEIRLAKRLAKELKEKANGTNG